MTPTKQERAFFFWVEEWNELQFDNQELFLNLLILHQSRTESQDFPSSSNHLAGITYLPWMATGEYKEARYFAFLRVHSHCVWRGLFACWRFGEQWPLPLDLGIVDCHFLSKRWNLLHSWWTKWGGIVSPSFSKWNAKNVKGCLFRRIILNNLHNRLNKAINCSNGCEAQNRKVQSQLHLWGRIPKQKSVKRNWQNECQHATRYGTHQTKK